jgi:hypothetical protein
MTIDTSREAVERADTMAGMLRMGERIAYGADADMICALSDAITTLRRDLLAEEDRGIQIGLRAAAKKLRSQGYGTAVRQILALTPDEARKMGEV